MIDYSLMGGVHKEIIRENTNIVSLVLFLLVFSRLCSRIMLLSL